MGNVFWNVTSNGDWNIATNWSPQVAPGPGDDAVLGVTGFAVVQAYTVTVSAAIHPGLPHYQRRAGGALGWRQRDRLGRERRHQHRRHRGSERRQSRRRRQSLQRCFAPGRRPDQRRHQLSGRRLDKRHGNTEQRRSHQHRQRQSQRFNDGDRRRSCRTPARCMSSAAIRPGAPIRRRSTCCRRRRRIGPAFSIRAATRWSNSLRARYNPSPRAPRSASTRRRASSPTPARLRRIRRCPA